MTPLPDTRIYFFQHQNNDGYIVALKSGVFRYFVVILKDGVEILHENAGEKQESVQNIYECVYCWLATNPPDVEKKCIAISDRLTGSTKWVMAFESLPQANVEITIPLLDSALVHKLTHGINTIST